MHNVLLTANQLYFWSKYKVQLLICEVTGTVELKRICKLLEVMLHLLVPPPVILIFVIYLFVIDAWFSSTVL